jgi:hypothetical protein
MDFPSFSILATPLKIEFFDWVPGSYGSFTTMPLLYVSDLRKSTDVAMWPLADGRRRLTGIPVVR